MSLPTYRNWILHLALALALPALPMMAQQPKAATGSAKGAAPSKPNAPAARKPLSTPVKAKPAAARKPSAAATAAVRRSAAAAAAREKAIIAITERISEPSSEYLEQTAALIPFFEQLYRQEHQLAQGPVRILQYGDSHTAGDAWTASIRSSLQARFGDGGSGFSHAGAPWRGYRRFDVSSKASLGWRSAGLIGRASLRGDEFQGLSGVSVSSSGAGEWISLVARCSSLEVFYLRQPEGGRFLLYDNDELVAEHSTEGELGPGILQLPTTTSGEHHFRIVTLDASPVRLFGWVAEHPSGVTYEPLGINGAQASITTRWNPEMFSTYVARRDPSLVVVAYGTNEAGQTIWNYENYYAEFDQLLKRIRAASPTASILVVGPPDRMWYQRRQGWVRAPRLDLVIRAQRDAARANRAAFWDTHGRMGGDGSMRNWVRAGLAGRDHVHFSSNGYRRLGEVLYQDLMVQYNEFKSLRRQWATADLNDGSTQQQSLINESTPRADPATRDEGLEEK